MQTTGRERLDLQGVESGFHEDEYEQGDLAAYKLQALPGSGTAVEEAVDQTNDVIDQHPRAGASEVDWARWWDAVEEAAEWGYSVSHGDFGQGPGWTQMDPAYQSCSDEMKGDEETCTRPGDIVRSVDDVFGFSLGVLDPVDIDAEFSDDEAAFLDTAWTIVQDNIDLMQWAVCWVTGRDAGSDCMEDNFHDGSFELRRDGDCVPDAYAHVNTVDRLWGRIQICDGSEAQLTDKYMPAWQDGSDVDRLCAVLDFACVLVHEMTHVCEVSLGDGRDNPCLKSYMIENAFRYSLFSRYRGTAGDGGWDSDCCKKFDDSSLFLSGESVGMSDDCLGS